MSYRTLQRLTCATRRPPCTVSGKAIGRKKWHAVSTTRPITGLRSMSSRPCSQGTTVLLCTQYLDEADRLADRIAVIDRGKVIAEGTPGRLKASVGQGALHVRLLDAEHRIEAERVLSRVLGGEPHLEADPAALSVPVADATRASEALAELAAAGITPADFSLGQPSLDAVFLALTGHPAEDVEEEAAA